MDMCHKHILKMPEMRMDSPSLVTLSLALGREGWHHEDL